MNKDIMRFLIFLPTLIPFLSLFVLKGCFPEFHHNVIENYFNFLVAYVIVALISPVYVGMYFLNKSINEDTVARKNFGGNSEEHF